MYSVVEVVFLGTGDSFSKGPRSNVALLIESGDFSMLVEAGPTILYQLARVNLFPPDLERLFVSHPHGDHILGFPMIILNRLSSTKRLQVYAAPDAISTLQMLWALAFPDFDSNYLKCDWHRLSDRRPDKVEVYPGVTLRSVVVPYPPGATTLAARWDFADGPAVTYVTDTIPNAATIELAQGCDLLIHEANYSVVLQPDIDPAVHFHSTAQQAGEIARRAGCPRLALIHLNHEICDHPKVLIEEACAGTDLQVIVPEEGERIRLDVESE